MEKHLRIGNMVKTTKAVGNETPFLVLFPFLALFEFCFLSFVSSFNPFASSGSNGVKVEKIKFRVSFSGENEVSTREDEV